MNGAIEYLKSLMSKGKRPAFSEIIYIESDGQTAQKDWTLQQAKAIYTQYIWWIPANTGATFSFLDQFDNVIFSTIDNFTVPNYSQIQIVKQGSIFRITCTQPGISFNVAYQYVMEVQDDD